MAIEKKKGLLVKLVGALLLCGSCTFADYIEGIDTTDVTGMGWIRRSGCLMVISAGRILFTIRFG
jgi:hypothetical protein